MYHDGVEQVLVAHFVLQRIGRFPGQLQFRRPMKKWRQPAPWGSPRLAAEPQVEDPIAKLAGFLATMPFNGDADAPICSLSQRGVVFSLSPTSEVFSTKVLRYLSFEGRRHSESSGVAWACCHACPFDRQPRCFTSCRLCPSASGAEKRELNARQCDSAFLPDG